MGLFFLLVAPGVIWRAGKFPWGRAAQQDQLLVLKPHLGASSEMGKRQRGLNLQRFGDYITNVANHELCSCGVCLGREPGGSFHLLTEEQVLQRKPISETFSKNFQRSSLELLPASREKAENPTQSQRGFIINKPEWCQKLLCAGACDCAI